jgi:catechol 2,3-dioxygenase-like lactoylglutathione lyase family enzyme
MRRTWTIVGVADVARSYRWYQALLGLPQSAPAHDHFGQLCDDDGTVLLCLHQWGAHEHPSLTSADVAPPGNGLLLFFRVDGFASALQRACALVDRLDEEPHVNPNTGTPEFSLRDPDGYHVTISALAAAADPAGAPPPMTDHPLALWHRVARERDPALLDALLDADVVFHSPVVHTPQRGKALATMYLGAAVQLLGNPTFRYVREIVGEYDAMLEFETEIDGVLVNGVDLLRWNAAGRVVDFKVILRPLKAINLIHERMGAMLQRAAPPR